MAFKEKSKSEIFIFSELLNRNESAYYLPTFHIYP